MNSMKNVLVALEFYRGPLFEGIAEYAKRNNWHLSLEMLANPGNIPWGWQGDGVITMLVKEEVNLVKFLSECQRPVVNLEGRQIGDYPRVLSDTAKAAEMAFKYFRSMGFVHFGFYGYKHSVRGRDFVHLVESNGFYCDRLYESELTWQEQINEVSDWLKKQTMPLALFCWNDYAGARFIDIAKVLGYDIPNDIAVLGMDNEELICNSSAVRLTSIQTDIKKIGYRGADLLNQIMLGEEIQKEPQLMTPSEIIERDSTDTLAVSSVLVKESIKIMRKEYQNGINISELLKKLGVSRRGLEKACMNSLGQTPHDILLGIRMEKAKLYLRESSDKIAIISQMIGLSDPKYFSIQFRKKIGLSPKQYREKWQE